MSQSMLFAVLFPVMAGIVLLAEKEMKNRRVLLLQTGAFLALSGILAVWALVRAGGEELLLFHMTESLPIVLRLDGMGRIFAWLATIVFLCAGFFSFSYMSHEQKEKRYYGCYLMVFGILLGSCFAGNLITFYLFFELLTLSSMPLILHSGTRESVMAALKYLFYSLGGAYMALFGLYFVYRYGSTLRFTEGGVLLSEAAAQHKELLLLAAFLMILGFSVKGGMFPFHAWLPAAHPVAPGPASAVLSAVIVKAGVLGLLRTVYYIFGTEFLRGTWVQNTFLTLTLITVFMGSMLAYREPVLKKRLAYSTVSQISYILFGLAVMDTEALTGSLLHVLGHGFIKAALFLCAGAIIFQTGKTRVSELRGAGKEMPVLLWCYTIVSLGLIGIPPTGGFISKWYLAEGALAGGLSVFGWLGPVILLISALLTAGYLLPVAISGFFPGADYDYKSLKKKEPGLLMNVPVLILTGLSVLMGLFPNGLIRFFEGLAAGLF